MTSARKAAFEWPKAAVVRSISSPPKWAKVRQMGAQWAGMLKPIRAGSAARSYQFKD